jgi:hypothetical protein
VDFDNREGGWANAGKDFRVDRARGDCDIVVVLRRPSLYSYEYIRCTSAQSEVEEGKGKVKIKNDAVDVDVQPECTFLSKLTLHPRY